MPTVNTLVADFIAAGDTTVLAAGQALHAHVIGRAAHRP
jgi:hypothetical protein